VGIPVSQFSQGGRAYRTVRGIAVNTGSTMVIGQALAVDGGITT
jgi:hypothetical protein